MNLPSVSIFRRVPASRPRRANWAAGSDMELALAARVQDKAGKEAFVEIVRRHQTAVCAVAYSVTGRVGMADDIAQETFLKAWKRLATLREPAKLKSWLTKIAHDCAVDALRREKPGLPLDDERVNLTAATDAAPDEAAADAEQEAMVWSALAELPEIVRTPLVLYYREGQSVAAVAAALDLSEDAVRQRLSRGRNELREQVAAKIEGVLGRVRPNPMLVATVASAIGLAAAPETLAAAATGPSGTGSAASGISSPWIAAAAALVAGVPLGWSLHAPAPAAKAAPSATTPLPADPLAEFADSALLREWRRLHTEHGRDAAAMPVIFEAVQNLENDFHRRALRRTLLTEWAGVDAAGGLEYLHAKKQTAHAVSLSHEWLKRDPAAAADGLMLYAASAPEIVRELLMTIAEKVPDKLSGVAGGLATPKGAGKKEIAAAFTVFAAKNPAAARTAAESLSSGTARDAALAGVAGGWAQRDGAAAFAWSKTLKPTALREAALSASLPAWAGADPAAALPHFKDVPDSKPPYDDYAQGAFIRAVIQRDPDLALSWATQQSEQLNSSSHWDQFGPLLASRYKTDPAALLQWLSQQDSRTRNWLGSSLAREAANTGMNITDALWDWLDTLPQDYQVENLRKQLESPARKLAWLQQLPDRWESRSTIREQVTEMLRDGTIAINHSREAAVDQLLPEFPAALQPGLYEAALEGKTDWDEASLEKWASRVAAMPVQGVDQPTVQQAGRVASAVARGIGSLHPEDAAEWSQRLPDGPARNAAHAEAVKIWTEVDAAAASTWVNDLPAGAERDHCARALVTGLLKPEPEAAWAWAANIRDWWLQDSAQRAVLSELRTTNPQLAGQFSETPEVRPEVRRWYQREYLTPRNPNEEGP
jgi:RNA polymerase sigma factor (sigma-70 family)